MLLLLITENNDGRDLSKSEDTLPYHPASIVSAASSLVAYTFSPSISLHPLQLSGMDDAEVAAKCDALRALLRAPQAVECQDDISSTANSLCDLWWAGLAQHGTAGRMDLDSNLIQNTSSMYSIMLLSEAMAELHRCSEKAPISNSLGRAVQERAPIVVVQILTKILSTQTCEGLWAPLDRAEVTAFAVLALRSIAGLLYLQVVETEIRDAVARGRQALFLLHKTSELTASSSTISETCVLSAMEESPAELLSNEPTSAVTKKQIERAIVYTKFFSSLDHLKTEPSYLVKLSILEASFYQPSLKAVRTHVFPQTLAKEKDKYLEYIPIMWTLPSTCRGLFSPPEYLLDMMILSMFIFLVDEYMEANVIHFSKEELAAFRESLEEIHPDDDPSRTSVSPPAFLQDRAASTSAKAQHPSLEASPRLQAAVSVFRSFATAVLQYPRVASASQSDLLELRSETKRYLLYHLVQLEDNARFATQVHHPDTSTKFSTPRTSYQTWVHSVGAGHVSGPFSFAFFAASMGGSARKAADCFTTVSQKLRAFHMNGHIGAFCRMYNDYGSIARDRDERNLNSVNFPEFFRDGVVAGADVDEAAKAELLRAARYERQCALDSAEVLYRDLEAEGAAGRRVADCLRVYMGACEQFSDMYLTRDVTNRVK